MSEYFRRLYSQCATGELAALRRLDPDRPAAGAFFRLLANEVPESLARPELRRRWGLVVWAMAQSPDALSERPLEQALAQPVGAGSPVISEARVNRLLAARGVTFRAQLRLIVRMLTSAGVPLPYRDLARFVFAESRDERTAEELRLRIARDYWRTRPRENGDNNHDSNGGEPV